MADIATIQGGGTPSRAELAYFGGDVPWVTPTDLPAVGKIDVLGDVSESLSEAGLANSSARLIPAGSVLFSSRASIGKIAVTDRSCATNQGFINLTPKIDTVCPWFLAYLLGRYTGELKTLAGKTTFLEIPRGRFKDFEVEIPPLPEQHRIVARIKECMERVEEIEGLRDQASREAAAIEFACFHDGLIEGIEQQGWPVLQLGEVAKSFRYGTSAKAHEQPIGQPVLRMGNLQAGYLETVNLKYIDLPADEASRYKLSVGDVLINRTNSLELVGKAATFDVAEGDWLYASYLVRVEVDRDRVLPAFVTAVINSSMGRDYVLKTARRAIGMVNLNAKEMAKFPIPVPSLSDQEAVVERLRVARTLAKELRSSMADPEVGFLRQSVLRKAFAGEL